MKPFICGLIACLAAMVALPSHSQDPTWTEQQKPFRIYGNTYYVGMRGLSAILITSPQGHVLIDGTLEANSAQIEAHIKALGFRLQDVRLILNSHAHGDHAGAIAALARDTGAQVRASTAGARALMAGGKDPEDPQYAAISTFPRVSGVTEVQDGEAVRLGSLALTAHYTPGHTPGSTSWTWRSCEGDRCLNLVYADSLTPISNSTFRFTDDATHPHRVEAFRQAIATVASLPCDILMVPHPDAIEFMDKVARRDKGVRPDPLIDTQACRAYAAVASRKFDARMADEAKAGR
jgi:metallo-beta-lactamase class B